MHLYRQKGGAYDEIKTAKSDPSGNSVETPCIERGGAARFGLGWGGCDAVDVGTGAIEQHLWAGG